MNERGYRRPAFTHGLLCGPRAPPGPEGTLSQGPCSQMIFPATLSACRCPLTRTVRPASSGVTAARLRSSACGASFTLTVHPIPSIRELPYPSDLGLQPDRRRCGRLSAGLTPHGHRAVRVSHRSAPAHHGNGAFLCGGGLQLCARPAARTRAGNRPSLTRCRPVQVEQDGVTDLSVQLSGLTLVDPCGTPWACDTRQAVVSPARSGRQGTGAHVGRRRLRTG